MAAAAASRPGGYSIRVMAAPRARRNVRPVIRRQSGPKLRRSCPASASRASRYRLTASRDAADRVGALRLSHPRVTMAATSDGDGATLAVADNGPGFPAIVRERAFERFVKGQGSRGYGLGLALVRATARAHGGEARILETRGGGARVTLSFPSR